MSLARPSAPSPSRPSPTPPALPPLIEGQRLDQPTFHAGYAAMPPETLRGTHQRSRLHGQSALCAACSAQMPSAFWLLYYEEKTPGVDSLDNALTILGPRSEPQPDLQICASCPNTAGVRGPTPISSAVCRSWSSKCRMRRGTRIRPNMRGL